MSNVAIIMDGTEVRGREGMTILEAAEQIGIDIPTLCHRNELTPVGSCRICVVEVEGSGRLVGSCHTPIEEGMVIHTCSPRVLRARKATIELLLAGHTGPCVTDESAEHCELHTIAAQLESGPSRFSVRKPRFYPAEVLSPHVRRDMSKCILCYRCIRACREIVQERIYSMAYRGFNSKVVVDFDEPLNKEVCKDCGICIEYCPTSALTWPDGVKKEKVVQIDKDKIQEKLPLEDRESEKLLVMLEDAQRKTGYVSEESMARIGQTLGLTLSEIYGVATFYAFISVKPQGKNVIRICKSLPCYMKNAPVVIESVEKEIGIKPGETTPDGIFSFNLTNCIGACDHAPAMMVNDDVHGNLSPGKISEILSSYK